MLLNNKIQYVRDEKNIQLCQSSNMSQQIYDLSIEEYPLGIILPVRCNDKTNGYTNNLGGVITKHGEYVVSATIPGWVTGMYADYCCEHSSSVAVYFGRMIGQWGHFF